MLRIVLFTTAALVAALNFGAAPAQDVASASEAYTISRGAQLYDNWWVPIKAPKPEATHPAYPAAGNEFLALLAVRRHTAMVGLVPTSVAHDLRLGFARI